ncbi:MAG TPA: ubiquinol-cytochrome c reductase iron-sulfur subunit [Gemmataceae bacterium]|nr:ubiquinol-cytochrome c reductase iron-sulfur subunit [Gemmataceae bacterium]
MSNLGNSRRSFLSFLTTALLAVIAFCLATPVVAYIWAPLRRKGGSEVGADFSDAGPLTDLPAGKWSLLTIDVVRQDGWEISRTQRSVYARRSASNEPEAVTVLSPICPHLGCPINLDATKSEFKCPCHQGLFNDVGAWVSGPPPRGMDPLEHEIRAERLWVRWQDFKIGVPERVPVEI